MDVVICLSTTVRNDTLQDAKEHRVSVKCRKQLRVEEVEMVSPLSTLQLGGFIHLTSSVVFLVKGGRGFVSPLTSSDKYCPN